MIPSFLRSLASLIRRLLSENRCLHLTEADAVELEMLAGLFEETSISKLAALTYFVGERRREVTPADIALGFLRASRCVVVVPDGLRVNPEDPAVWVDEVAIKRAAVCAELALLAERAEKWSTVHAGGRVEEFPGNVRAHDGTPEGARAAWEFIVTAADVERVPLIEGAPRQEWAALLDKYRREMEAMQ